jgi:hypothetical protein
LILIKKKYKCSNKEKGGLKWQIEAMVTKTLKVKVENFPAISRKQ